MTPDLILLTLIFLHPVVGLFCMFRGGGPDTWGGFMLAVTGGIVLGWVILLFDVLCWLVFEWEFPHKTVPWKKERD